MDKWIVCLKHGTKYDSDYVNKLYNMVTRHSKIPFGFACITENPVGLNSDIKIITLKELPDVSGWWYKLCVFSKDIPLSGTIIFMDLDVVIINNIDELWSYNPGKFCVIRDFNRAMIKEWNKFNSSIFKFEKGCYRFVWENFLSDTKITKRMHGDQDWIFNQIKKDFVFWPDAWMQSYKWEIRDRQDVIRQGMKRVFKEIATPTINPKTKILVFHGEPKPSDTQDPIVVDNWK